MQLTRRLLPAAAARQPAARIVNVGSIFGYLGYPGYAAYCASKFALRGFSEALRRELADGPVRVRYFAPRATRTAMNGAALYALNAELGVAMDAPEAVASRAASTLLRAPGAASACSACPKRLFARLNQLLPGLVGPRAAAPACRHPPPCARRASHSRRSEAHEDRECLVAAPTLRAAGRRACARRRGRGRAQRCRANGRRSSTARPPAEQEKAFADAAEERRRRCARKYADRAEPQIWYGIIVASYAGAQGRPGRAVARQGREEGLRAGARRSIPKALDGSAYTSLGSLYYQVPGWPIGFGNDDKARELLEKALALNPDGIDPNYFLGDFLYRKGDYDGARKALQQGAQGAAAPGPPARRRGPAQGDRVAARGDALTSALSCTACGFFWSRTTSSSAPASSDALTRAALRGRMGARRPPRARRAARGRASTLVVLDLGLPGMDGLEVLRSAARRRRAPRRSSS